MAGSKESALVAKVREAGEVFTIDEILEYTRRAGISPERLEEMTGPEIVRVMHSQLDAVYRPKSW